MVFWHFGQKYQSWSFASRGALDPFGGAASFLKKYGDDAIRSELKQEFDAPVPTEGFQRSIVLKADGPGTKSKPKEKDPLKSLLKAMGVSKTAGTKKNQRPITKSAGDGGDGPKFDPNNGRPTRRRQIGESPEEFARYAR